MDNENTNVTGTGTTTAATDIATTTTQANQEPAKDTTAAAATPFKAFATEEEYKAFVKSEAGKAKNELMKEMGVKSVQETKDAIAKASTLETQINEFKTKYQALEEDYAITAIGVKDEFKEEALTLAKAKVNEKVGLKDALLEVGKKLPNILKSPITDIKIGGDKTKQDSLPDDNVTKAITAKAPWIKF